MRSSKAPVRRLPPMTLPHPAPNGVITLSFWPAIKLPPCLPTRQGPGPPGSDGCRVRMPAPCLRTLTYPALGTLIQYDRVVCASARSYRGLWTSTSGSGHVFSLVSVLSSARCSELTLGVCGRCVRCSVLLFRVGCSRAPRVQDGGAVSANCYRFRLTVFADFLETRAVSN